MLVFPRPPAPPAALLDELSREADALPFRMAGAPALAAAAARHRAWLAGALEDLEGAAVPELFRRYNEGLLLGVSLFEACRPLMLRIWRARAASAAASAASRLPALSALLEEWAKIAPEAGAGAGDDGAAADAALAAELRARAARHRAAGACFCGPATDDDSLLVRCGACGADYHPRCVGLGLAQAAALELPPGAPPAARAAPPAYECAPCRRAAAARDALRLPPGWEELCSAEAAGGARFACRATGELSAAPPEGSARVGSPGALPFDENPCLARARAAGRDPELCQVGAPPPPPPPPPLVLSGQAASLTPY